MANEFGNVGAVSSLSKQRLDSKKVETISSLDTAEYEAYYGGYWRDISSDYSYDRSKAGNTFARCIRWDNDGFRSYRTDRGLIIRKKETEDDQSGGGSGGSGGIDDDSGGFNPVSTFASAAAFSFGISLGVQSYKKYLEPVLLNTALGKAFMNKPLTGVGKFLDANKVTLAFTAFNLFQDTGQSTSEKLGQAALSIATGMAVSKYAGKYGFLVGPAIGAVESIFQGQSIEYAATKALGGIVGGQFGKLTGGKVFGNTQTVQTVQNVSTKTQTPQGYGSINMANQGAGAQTYKTINYPMSMAQDVVPDNNMFQRVTAISNEASRATQSQLQNVAAAASVKSSNGLKQLSKGFKQTYKQKGRVF